MSCPYHQIIKYDIHTGIYYEKGQSRRSGLNLDLINI